MSRFFLTLMIVLLPLRGWAGDAISIEMAQAHRAASPAMAADCGMQMSDEMPTSGHEDGPGGSHSGCDSACDLCLPFAGFSHMDVSAAPFLPETHPLPGSFGFISASPAQRFKAPIS